MEKKVVLSLVAMASAPLAGYADADLANNVEEAINAFQSQNGLSIEDGVFVSTGAPVELGVGQLVKGEYSLTAATQGDNVKLSVTVDGVPVELVSGKFELTAAGNVVIKAESTDGKEFNVGGFTLAHKYDYDAVAKELRDQLAAIISKLDKDYYDDDKEARELKLKASGIAEKIEPLESTDDNVRYTAYKDLKLYDGVQNSALVEEINSLDESVATLVAKAEAAQNANKAVAALEEELAKVKAKLNASSDYAKGKLKGEYDRIEKDVEEYREGIKTAYENGSATDKYTEAKIQEFAGKVNGEIAGLSSRIEQADLDDEAYKKVASTIEAAKAEYTDALAALRVALPGAPDVYEDLYKEAQGILAEAMSKIVAAETENGTAEAHDKASDTKDANLKKLNEAKATIAKTLKDYTTRAKKLQTAYKEAQAAIKERLQDRLDSKKKNIEEAGYSEKYKGDIDNVQGQIDDFSAEIEEANKKHTIADIPNTDIETKINAVEKAIQQLEEKAAADIANYEAWKTMDEEVVSLNSALDAARELVNALKSADGKYSVNGKYAGVEDAIQAEIKEYKDGADKAKGEGKAVDYQAANSDKVGKIQSLISDYSEKANSALGNYNKVASDLEELRGKFEELKADVKNPSVICNAETTVSGKTYGERLDVIGNEITSMDEAIEAALGLKDSEHSAAMTALKLKESLISDVKVLGQCYSTDENSYNYQNALAAAKALSEEADRLIKELRDKINESQATNEKELGSQYGRLQEELKTLEGEVDAVEKARPSEEPNAGNATEIMASLKTVVEEIGKINKKYEDLAGKISDAKDNITNNNKNKTAADALLREIEAILARAESMFGTSGSYDTVTPSDDFKRGSVQLKKDLSTIKADINTSYNNETLSTEWEGERADNEPFKTILDKKKAKANELLDKAKADKANYEAYQDLSKAYSKIDGNIQAAQDKVAEVVPGKGIGYAYYVDKVLGEECKTEADDIKNAIEEAYKGYSTVEEKESLNGRITALNNKIKAQPELAKANEDAHNEQVEEGKTVMDEWSKAYADISANDMSSKKDEQLEELAGYQDELIDLNNTVEKDWGEGKSDGNGAMDTYDKISCKIKTLLDSQKEKYDVVIEADNAKRYDDFVKEAKITQDIYIAAVNTLTKLTNTVNPEYASKIADVIGGSQNIYDYSVKIRNLKDEAKKLFKETESPVLWDSMEENKQKAQQLGEGINEALDILIAKIYEEAKSLLDEKLGTEGAQGKLDAAINDLKTQGYSESVIEGAFADVKALIDNVSQKEGSAFTEKKDYVLAADNMLSELDKVDSMIEAGQQDAATKEWNALISAKREQIKTERGKLAKYVEHGNLDASKLEEYDGLVAGTVGEAEKQVESTGDLYASLPEIKKLLDQFEEKNPYAELTGKAEADEANEKAYSEMSTQITGTQDALDALDAYARRYYIYNDCVSTINNLQNSIDNLQKDVEAAYGAGQAVEEQNGVEEAAGNIMKAVTSAKTMIDLLESNALKKEILNLRNLNAEVNGTDAAAFDAMEATIDGLEDRVTDLVLETASDEKQAALIGMEKEIAAVLTDLETTKNADAVADIRTALENAIGEVETAYKSEQEVLSGCHEPVKAEYGDDLGSVNEKIAAVKAEIETCGEDKTLLLYNENIGRSIKELSAELDDLSQKIAAAEAPYVANDAAYTSLTKVINALTSQKEAVENTINGYKDEIRDDAKIKGMLSDISELIAEATENVDARYKAIELDENSTVPNNQKISDMLTFVAKLAANRQAFMEIEDLRTELDEVKATIDRNNYSAETGKTLYGEYSGLLKGITSLDTYRLDAFINNCVTKDIDGNELLDKDGKPVASLPIDFIKEAIPAINAKIAEMHETIKSLAETAESESFILGDINRDGNVMVDDYGTLLNVILKRETIEEGTAVFLAADLNGDGSMDIGDLTAMAQIIRGTYDASARVKARRAAVASNDALSLSVEGEGTTQRIAINLQNSMAYTGCQMDIVLPAGITLVNESLGSRAAGYTLSSNDLDNGAHRIVLSSLDDAVFADGTGAIIYLDVEVAHSYSGEGIEVSDIMFTDAAARVYNLPGISGNEATGVSTVTIGQAIKSKIYSVSGRLMDGLKRGINIIRNSDGTTKKIIVK